VHAPAALLWLSDFVVPHVHGLQLQMLHAQDDVLELVMTHLDKFDDDTTARRFRLRTRAVSRAGQLS
jgi:hypothetical protein